MNPANISMEVNDHDLLLAVRYLTDECDSLESAAFEDRLADDESAQAALVEATRIVALLKATPDCPEATISPVHQRTLAGGRWGAILAASVVVGAGLLWVMESSRESSEVATLNPSTSVAQAWTALASSDSDQVDPDDELSESGEIDVADVPDWLLTAVMVQEGDADHEENVDSEGQL